MANQLTEEFRGACVAGLGCLEVAAGFKTVSNCVAGLGCVEAARELEVVKLRKTADPTTVLEMKPAEWSAFIAGVKRGEFDID